MKTKIYSSIDDIPRDAWDSLLGDGSCVLSHDFWTVLERARMKEFDFRHALFFDDDDRLAGFASFYTISTDIAIFASGRLRRVIERIRRFLPGFFILRMLECGTPVTLSSPPWAVAPGTPTTDFVDALHEMLATVAQAEKQHLVIIRDFEPNAGTACDALQAKGYHAVASLPNTYLDIRWSTPDEYHDSLKSYYRSKLRKHHRRHVLQGIQHEIVEDFHGLADTLCAQWLTVHNQADEIKREVLTPDFYRELSTRLGTRSKVILVYREKHLVAHALLLVDGDLLRWLYFGREVAVNDGLYLYTAQAVVETAIELKVRRLEMGLTTYPIKQDMGARLTPSRIALRSRVQLTNPIVGYLYRLLNTRPELRNRNIFKHDATDD